MKEGANTVAAMTALADSAAEQLEGTCKTLHELGPEFEDAEDSMSFCERLDELVFCCETCNWWHEQSEMVQTMNEITKFPWEPATRSTEDTVAALQRDLAYMVTHTAVLVHSNQPALAMLVNTLRGQLVPQGQCRFTDGSTLEFQDIGMPQVGAPTMTVTELLAHVWSIASELNLELQP